MQWGLLFGYVFLRPGSDRRFIEADVHFLENREMGVEPAFKMVPVGGFGGRPGAFGEGDESGKELAVDEGGFAVDMGPKVGLDSEEVLGLVRGEFGDRVECVNFFGTDGFVGVIEITVAGG